MPDQLPQSAREIVERLVASYNGERDSVIRGDLARIKMNYVAQNIRPGSSGEIGQMRDARQAEMDTRGMGIVATIRRVITEFGVEPYSTMADDLKSLLHICLRATLERLNSKRLSRGIDMGNEAVGVGYSKYEAEIDLFVESLRRDQRAKMGQVIGQVRVDAASGSVVLVQSGGAGNVQNVDGPQKG